MLQYSAGMQAQAPRPRAVPHRYLYAAARVSYLFLARPVRLEGSGVGCGVKLPFVPVDVSWFRPKGTGGSPLCSDSSVPARTLMPVGNTATLRWKAQGPQAAKRGKGSAERQRGKDQGISQLLRASSWCPRPLGDT